MNGRSLSWDEANDTREDQMSPNLTTGKNGLAKVPSHAAEFVERAAARSAPSEPYDLPDAGER